MEKEKIKHENNFNYDLYLLNHNPQFNLVYF